MRESAPAVIFVCTRGDDRDGIFPIGLIQCANQLKVAKRGLLLAQLSADALHGAKLVVIHLHWDFNYLYFDELIRYVKDHAPAAKILVGGYIATVHPERLLDVHSALDYVLAKDYEAPFVMLVEAVIAGRDDDWIRQNIPNLYSRAGAPLAQYRVSREELADLNSHSLEWFPALEKYLVFQDSLNLLGINKWREEQYFPSLIIKGSYNRHCLYCALSNQRFDGFCEAERYTYISEGAFVDFLERCRAWRGVNVFGDFASMDLVDILRRLEGRRFDFEITIGDLFVEIDIELLDRLTSHFSKVWLAFRTLPTSCYLGVQKITLEMIETHYNRALMNWMRGNPKASVRLWVNAGNLEPGVDFSAYSSHFLDLESWLRHPTQLPTQSSFDRLTWRTEQFQRLNDCARVVRVQCDVSESRDKLDQVEIDFDPFTLLRGEEQVARLINRSSATLEAITPDSIGRFCYRREFHVERALCVEFVVFDEKTYFQSPPRAIRSFSVRLPARLGLCRVEFAFVENIFDLKIRCEDGTLLADEILCYASGDLRRAAPEVFDRVAESFRKDMPRYCAVHSSSAPCMLGLAESKLAPQEE